MMDPLYISLGRSADFESVVSGLLERGLDICQSNFGNVQLMNWDAGHLQIKAQRGFQQEFLNFFECVALSDCSACARALRNREPIVIEDVMLDPQFARCREILCRAGVRAVQSTPMLSTSGALVGILSMHFSAPHRPTNLQLRAVQDVAHWAANAIIGVRARADGRDTDRLQNSRMLLRESRAAIDRADQILRQNPFREHTAPSP